MPFLFADVAIKPEPCAINILLVRLQTVLSILWFGEADQTGVMIIRSIDMDVELSKTKGYLSDLGEMLLNLALAEGMDVFNINMVLFLCCIGLDLNGLVLDLNSTLVEDFAFYISSYVLASGELNFTSAKTLKASACSFLSSTLISTTLAESSEVNACFIAVWASSESAGVLPKGRLFR